VGGRGTLLKQGVNERYRSVGFADAAVTECSIIIFFMRAA
jgi:hypothetical protein